MKILETKRKKKICPCCTDSDSTQSVHSGTTKNSQELSTGNNNITPTLLTFSQLDDKLAAASITPVKKAPCQKRKNNQTQDCSQNFSETIGMENNARTTRYPRKFLNFTRVEGVKLLAADSNKTAEEIQMKLIHMWNKLNFEQQKLFENSPKMTALIDPTRLAQTTPKKVSIPCSKLEDPTVQSGIRSSLFKEENTKLKVSPVKKSTLSTDCFIYDNSIPTTSESTISMISSDDEDCIDEYTEKHVSHARYHRNHELMAKIFSDTILPQNMDARDSTIICNARVDALRGQVYALEEHQKIVEKEIEDLDKHFEEKKRKLYEETDDFNRKCKRLSAQFTDHHVEVLSERLYQRCKQREREWLQQRQREVEQSQADDMALAVVTSADSSLHLVHPQSEPNNNKEVLNSSTVGQPSDTKVELSLGDCEKSTHRINVNKNFDNPSTSLSKDDDLVSSHDRHVEDANMETECTASPGAHHSEENLKPEEQRYVHSEGGNEIVQIQSDSDSPDQDFKINNDCDYTEEIPSDICDFIEAQLQWRQSEGEFESEGQNHHLSVVQSVEEALIDILEYLDRA